jgi:hypothetical protein
MRRNFMSRLWDFHANALNLCHQRGATFNSRE